MSGYGRSELVGRRGRTFHLLLGAIIAGAGIDDDEARRCLTETGEERFELLGRRNSVVAQPHLDRALVDVDGDPEREARKPDEALLDELLRDGLREVLGRLSATLVSLLNKSAVEDEPVAVDDREHQGVLCLQCGRQRSA